MDEIARRWWWAFPILSIILKRLYDKRTLNKNSLRGKVVLITGASSGLGEALAHAFYKVGCQVILAARREKELQRVKDELIKTNPSNKLVEPYVLPLDLTDLDSLPHKVTSVLDKFKAIDILVNNGGTSYRGCILKTEMDVHQQIMLTNYFGQVALTKAVLPIMLEQKSGHIVTIGSVQGRIALPHRSAYGASKHALQAFFDCLRAEVNADNIHVTMINPGYIKTELSINALTDDGKNYGVMDSSTERGYLPSYVADEVMRAILLKSNEITVAPLMPRIAIGLRNFYSDLFFWIMAKRAKTVK